ncbi:MAG: energy transducer TonB [Fusobacteriaceae bacterium]|nr:energy transducer TonB [Fusobacteriaceae bacterium]
MKLVDCFSYILSLAVNIAILFVIPQITTKTVTDKTIKVGLVAYEDTTKVQVKTKGEAKKNTSRSNISNQTKNENKVETETAAALKKEEALKKINESAKKPEINVLASEAGKRESGYPGIAAGIREKDLSEGIAVNAEDLAIQKTNPGDLTEIREREEKLRIESPDVIAINTEVGNDITFDRILEEEEETIGLPGGYRLGTVDGDVVARWDDGNKEPVYPESAQLRGMHGTVRIRVTIDENGNITRFVMEKGSGVPEINQAIEEVGRTWKIYLSKRGLNVQGDVILDYNFTLRGYN